MNPSVSATQTSLNSSTNQKIRVLFNQILIDFKVLKNCSYTNNNDSATSTHLLNLIEQLKVFLLQFTGYKPKPSAPPGASVPNYRFRNNPDTISLAPSSSFSSENPTRMQNSDETDFVLKNNQVKLTLLVENISLNSSYTNFLFLIFILISKLST